MTDTIETFLGCSQFDLVFKQKFIEQHKRFINDHNLLFLMTDPSENQLSYHLDYFQNVLENNQIHITNLLLTRELLTKAIIQYVRSNYYLIGQDLELGMDLKQLIKQQDWSRLSITDTAPREHIINIYLRLVTARSEYSTI